MNTRTFNTDATGITAAEGSLHSSVTEAGLKHPGLGPRILLAWPPCPSLVVMNTTHQLVQNGKKGTTVLHLANRSEQNDVPHREASEGGMDEWMDCGWVGG